MPKWAGWLIVIAGSVWLLGCGAEDTAEQPVELSSIDPEARFKTVWKRDTGAGTGDQLLDLQPWIGSDAVYVADHQGRLVSIDKSNGKKRWEIDTGLKISGGVGGDGNLLFVGSGDGILAAYWRDSGEQAWRTRLSSEMLSVPVAEAGVVVARTVDGNIQAYSTSNGEKQWSYSYSVPSLSLRGTSTPVIYGGAALTGTDNGRLIGLSLNEGRLVFEATVAVPSGYSELHRMVDVDAPVTVDRQIIYAAAFQGRVVAFDMRSGQIAWARDRSVYRPMAVDSSHLYVVDELSHVSALDRWSGSTSWTQEKLHARPTSGVAVHDNAVLLGDFEGYLHALHQSDGRFIARRKLGAAIAAAPQIEDERIYVWTRDGDLYALTLESLSDS